MTLKQRRRVAATYAKGRTKQMHIMLQYARCITYTSPFRFPECMHYQCPICINGLVKCNYLFLLSSSRNRIFPNSFTALLTKSNWKVTMLCMYLPLHTFTRCTSPLYKRANVCNVPYTWNYYYFMVLLTNLIEWGNHFMHVPASLIYFNWICIEYKRANVATYCEIYMKL